MLSWRLQVDEDFPRPVADRLAALGYHVRRPQPQECGRKDWQWLRWCRDHDYVLCTCNLEEYLKYHRQWVPADDIHCGVLAVVNSWSHEEQFEALKAFLAAWSPNDVINEAVEIPKSA